MVALGQEDALRQAAYQIGPHPQCKQFCRRIQYIPVSHRNLSGYWGFSNHWDTTDCLVVPKISEVS